MSDDKYSIDDILAEIDRKRDGGATQDNSDSSDKIYGAAGRSVKSDDNGGEPVLTGKQHDLSVTEIIDDDEIAKMLRSAGKQKPTEDDIAESGEPVLTAKQLNEEEENRRRAADIAAAADRKKKSAKKAEKIAKAENAKKAQENPSKPEKAAKAEKQEEQLAAKQRTESEVNARRISEINAAADRKNAKLAEEKAAEPQEEKHSGFTAEMSSANDAAKLFGAGEEPEEEPEREEDNIVFHSESDIVVTDTMQIRKQQRIEEINRALLKADSEAETPDELLDSLNPMDSRAKAAEDLKAVPEKEVGDTLAVSGNDLKRIANGAERVKEYSPVTSRKRGENEKSADSVLFTPTAKQRPSKPAEGFVESLNKKADEQREKILDNEQTVVMDDLSGAGKRDEPLNVDADKFIDTSIISDGGTAEVNPDIGKDPVEAVRRADELAQRKKRKLSGFILEDIEEGVDSASVEEEDDEEEEEEIDLDDENVIAERLTRASKGLLGRLGILALLFAAALLVAIINEFNLDLGFISNIVSKRSNPDGFLYTYLVIGILSFSACSSVISNGFSRLIKLRPDGDTLCAFAHVTAIVALIPYLSLEEYIQRGMSHVYLVVSLAALCFNTISKLFTVWSAKRNFKFTSGDSAKFFVERSDSESAEQLARGSVSGMPVVTSMRKTELLCDFIISTYCEDVSDRIARIVTPITCAAAVAAGVGAYFMVDSVYVMNHISWASTVASAIFSIGATFTGSLIVASPMLTASKKLTASNAAVLGYNAVDEISETNAVLIEAKTLFPANSVVINNIWDYNKHRKGNSPKVPIDEAIIYAASLAIASDSILSDAFFNMLNYKQPLLKSVSNCVYESNLGVMGWIDRRRVLLGNREHMKSHGIVVPDMKKESAANKNGDEVIYLAVGGEVCMLFFVELFANTQVKENVIKLAKHGVSLVIKTVDGMITQSVISELFDISSEKVKIIPFEAHEDFNEHTKFVPKGSAAASCDGTFTSFAAVVNGAKNLKEKITFGCTMQITGIALGMLLAIIFMLFENYGMFNCLYLLLYNVAWVALTAIVQAFKRI